MKVLAAVRKVPRGRVATYGDIAELAGQPRAARAVGNIMRTCGGTVPAHRVIAANGNLGGYGGSEHFKRSLLVAEGVTFRGARVHPFDEFRWKPARRTTSARTTRAGSARVRAR